MESAFGIDHGEISKVKGPPKLTGVTGRLTGAQVRTAGQGAPSRTSKTKRALHKIGEADISLKGLGGAAGRGLKGTGSFLENRPGLTGTALVGGGGAAGYKYLSNKEPKR